MNINNEKTQNEIENLINKITQKNQEKLIELISKKLNKEIPKSKSNLRNWVEIITVNLLSSSIWYLIVKYSPTLFDYIKSALLREEEEAIITLNFTDVRNEHQTKIQQEFDTLMQREKIQFETDSDRRIFDRALSQALKEATTAIKAELE